MIAYIEGRLAETHGNACLVVTEGGVGYEIFLPAHTLSGLPQRGGHMSLHTCLVVREDAMELYGFSTFDERQTFLVLISLSKVGAKTALGVLSIFRPDDLRRLVLEEDVLALTRVSGIGKKSAQHIFLELKYKLKTDGQEIFVSAAPGRAATVLRDVIDGLANLGYGEDEASAVARKVLHAEPDLDVPGALRAALKALAADRL